MRLVGKTGLGAFAVGLTAGMLVLLLWGDVRSEVAPELAPALAPPTPAKPELPQVASIALEDLDLLREVLVAEVAAREELEIEVDELREELTSLRSQRERSPPISSLAVLPLAELGGSPRFDQGRLMEAGLDRGRAEQLHEVYERSQLDSRNLSERADAQLREARSQQTVALQEELGPEMYDLMLYGAGTANRVVVRNVFPGSNAEVAGLQEGDIIRSYDDQPVFEGQDLRYRVAQQADRRTPVNVGLERDGATTTVRVPPGFMGVQISGASRQPEVP